MLRLMTELTAQLEREAPERPRGDAGGAPLTGLDAAESQQLDTWLVNAVVDKPTVY